MNRVGSNPPADHQRPDGIDDVTLEATARLAEALEYVIRARGHLYSLHHLVGRADMLAGEAADLLERAGRSDEARQVREGVVGRDVLPGHWTFQIVEEFDATYYEPFQATEAGVRDRLLGGRRHVREAGMKQERRTPRATERLSPDD